MLFEGLGRETIELAFRGVLLDLPVPEFSVVFRKPRAKFRQFLRREPGDDFLDFLDTPHV